MPSIINSDNGATSGSAGLKFTSADDGVLQIQNNGTDAVTVADDGDVTLAADLSVTGNLLFNSGFGSAATAYGCRAWVNFNGTGAVAIRGRGNVSSITDHGTGNYTANFTTAMPDVNYCAVGSTIGSVNTSYATYLNSDNTALSTSGVRVEIRNSSSNAVLDMPCVNIAVFR